MKHVHDTNNGIFTALSMSEMTYGAKGATLLHSHITHLLPKPPRNENLEHHM